MATPSLKGVTYWILCCLIGSVCCQNYFLVEGNSPSGNTICVYQQGNTALECTDISEIEGISKVAVDERDDETTMVYWANRDFANESLKRRLLRSSDEPELIIQTNFIDDLFIHGDYLYYLTTQGVNRIPLDDIHATPELIYSVFLANRIGMDGNGTLYTMDGSSVYKCPQNVTLCDSTTEELVASVEVSGTCTAIGGFHVAEERVYFTTGECQGLGNVNTYYASTTTIGQTGTHFANVYASDIATVDESVFLVESVDSTKVAEYDLEGNLIASVSIGWYSSVITPCSVCGRDFNPDAGVTLSISFVMILLLCLVTFS